jgi:DNA gyrase subunit A
MRPIGRNTNGVRLIRVEEGHSVSSLAKLPETELLQANDETLALEGPIDGEAIVKPPTHILDDGVAEAEASDHIDDEDLNGEPDAE